MRVFLLVCFLCFISPITSQLHVTTPTLQFGPQGTYTTFQDVAVDAAGNIYVLDSAITPGGSTVHKFSSTGVPITTSPYPLQSPAPIMAAPYGLHINDGAGLIIVGDSQSQSGGGNNRPRLVLFNLVDGSFIRAINITGAPTASTARKLTSSADGTIAYIGIEDKVYKIPTNGIDPITTYDGTGGGDPFHGFSYLMSVQIDPTNSDHLYLADAGQHNRVAHLEMSTNTIIHIIDNPDTTGCPISCANIGEVDLDSHGNLYITSSLGHVVLQMVGVTDVINTEYAKSGMQIGGVTINSQDQVIAGDTETQQIYIFNQAQVSGDPQFMGFQQQSFQVHGASHEFFNLITAPSFQLNSRFIYLATGSCTYNETECWTHPGTYVDQLGLMLPGVNIQIIAGPHSKGMHVTINDEPVIPSQQKYHIPIEKDIRHHHIDIHYISKGHIMIMTPIISMDIKNSDLFFNLGFSLHSSLSKLLHAGRVQHRIKSDAELTTFYPNFPLHGLVGQTWRNARYAENRMYQGDITDYMLDDSRLMSTRFTYNLYEQ